MVDVMYFILKEGNGWINILFLRLFNFEYDMWIFVFFNGFFF